MPSNLKDLIKLLLPHGICEYSIRRNSFLRMGLPSAEASSRALGSGVFRATRDARLDLVPPQIVKNLHTCVDAGAHEGTWTEALRSIFHPKLVLMIECEPRLVSELQKRFNQFPDVRVIDAALSGSDGSSNFFQLRHPAASSLLQPRDDVKKEFARDSWDVIACSPVKTVSYDRLVENEKEVSILKLDVQGAETQILKGSQSGLLKTKTIIMEAPFVSHYESDSTFPQLHELMESKGFGLYRLSDAYDRGGRALYADAVYVREELLSTFAPASDR